MRSRNDDVQTLMSDLGEPFARALGVFLREVMKEDSGGGNGRLHSREGVGAIQPIEDLEPELADHLNRLIDEQDELLAQGKLETVEFTEDMPAQAAARRLRRVAKQRGVTQKELARRLGVTPAVISRVFKNPNRSKVQTLRRIADALGVELVEIVA